MMIKFDYYNFRNLNEKTFYWTIPYIDLSGADPSAAFSYNISITENTIEQFSMDFDVSSYSYITQNYDIEYLSNSFQNGNVVKGISLSFPKFDESKDFEAQIKYKLFGGSLSSASTLEFSIDVDPSAAYQQTQLDMLPENIYLKDNGSNIYNVLSAYSKQYTDINIMFRLLRQNLDISKVQDSEILNVFSSRLGITFDDVNTILTSVETHQLFIDLFLSYLYNGTEFSLKNALKTFTGAECEIIPVKELETWILGEHYLKNGDYPIATLWTLNEMAFGVVIIIVNPYKFIFTTEQKALINKIVKLLIPAHIKFTILETSDAIWDSSTFDTLYTFS